MQMSEDWNSRPQISLYLLFVQVSRFQSFASCSFLACALFSFDSNLNSCKISTMGGCLAEVYGHPIEENTPLSTLTVPVECLCCLHSVFPGIGYCQDLICLHMSLDLFQISPQHFQVLFFDFKLAYFQMSAQLQPMQTCYQIGQNRKWFSNGMCFEQTPGTTELTEG